MDEKQRHDLKNHLAIVLGFLELVLEITPPSDPRHADLLEVRRAAQACLSVLEPRADGMTEVL
jgi:hypothetical protein